MKVFRLYSLTSACLIESERCYIYFIPLRVIPSIILVLRIIKNSITGITARVAAAVNSPYSIVYLCWNAVNPSWSTIVAICYYGRDIPNLHIKISMLLATQNPMQFRMLLNIMNEYIRDDGTSPIYEINIGNGSTAANFIQCAKELHASEIKGVSLAAHIYINPDLGMENFNWTDHMFRVLESGTDMTFKYESDGTAHELDTMATYFVSEEERDSMAKDIGEVIYNKALRASKDGRAMMKRGIRAIYAKSCQQH